MCRSVFCALKIFSHDVNERLVHQIASVMQKLANSISSTIQVYIFHMGLFVFRFV